MHDGTVNCFRALGLRTQAAEYAAWYNVYSNAFDNMDLLLPQYDSACAASFSKCDAYPLMCHAHYVHVLFMLCAYADVQSWMLFLQWPPDCGEAMRANI